MSEASITSVSDSFLSTRPEPAPDIFSIACDESQVPPYAQAELERLYGNIYSSLPQFKIRGVLADAPGAYVVHKGEQVTALFLFRRDGYAARVLNEGIRIDGEELHRFVSHMFSTYRSLQVITFHAVQPETRLLAFPYQRFNCLEDIVLTLPADCATYLASMGNSTRNYIKRYMNKLKRAFPSFRHEVYLNGDIDERHVREIVRLNSARMAEKGKPADIDEREVQNIIRLVKECGMVSVVLIDGRIRAGTINYQVRDNYFLETIAHDPEFNDFRLGTLCCYLTICECIARGGNEYHFLWGKNEYKYRLLGVERQLDHLAVYRSRRHLLLNAMTVMRNVAARARRNVQLRLHELQARDDMLSRWLLHSLKAIRNLKHRPVANKA